MAGAVENLKMTKGETYEKTWTVTYPGLSATYGARMEVREDYGGTQVARLTSAAGADGSITLTNAGTDTVTVAISLPASYTTTMTAKNYLYDLELFSGSTVRKPLRGQFLVIGEVTTGA